MSSHPMDQIETATKLPDDSPQIVTETTGTGNGSTGPNPGANNQESSHHLNGYDAIAAPAELPSPHEPVLKKQKLDSEEHGGTFYEQSLPLKEQQALSGTCDNPVDLSDSIEVEVQTLAQETKSVPQDTPFKPDAVEVKNDEITAPLEQSIGHHNEIKIEQEIRHNNEVIEKETSILHNEVVSSNHNNAAVSSETVVSIEADIEVNETSVEGTNKPQETFQARPQNHTNAQPDVSSVKTEFNPRQDIETVDLSEDSQTSPSKTPAEPKLEPITQSHTGFRDSHAISVEIDDELPGERSETNRNFTENDLHNHQLPSKNYSNSQHYLKSEVQDSYSVEDSSSNDVFHDYKPTTNIQQPNTFQLDPDMLVRDAQQFSAMPIKSTTKFPPANHTSTAPVPSLPKKNRLVILYDKLRFYHLIMHLGELRKKDENLIILELPQIEKLLLDPYISKVKFDFVNISIEYNDDFQKNLKKLVDFIESNPSVIKYIPNIAYHVHFAPNKKWKTDYKPEEKMQYNRFLEVLNKIAGENVTQCSIINKYDMDTVYLTEKSDLETLGEEIQQDVSYWKNLRIFDYGESSIRFLPGVKFPDTLEILNIGGGYALETLTGFKMPPKLRTLLAGQGALHTIDNITFPPTLERLELSDNKIYFLTYVEFPPNLEHLDVSQNRIDSLRGVNFPKSLISLNLGYNPIDSIKGVRFPEGLKYLDVANIPNESMTGVKFPDLLINLNLQASMTNTRGLKLPPYLLNLSLCDNGVNSINPLKLPNSIAVLYLNNNNIKTLNKVQFPTNLRELYLGNNMITTFKNVQFPPTLEVLDMEMDPEYDEQEKHITTLKDVIFPPNLKVLKLGYHSIKLIEAIEFPYSLVHLSLPYNEIKVIRNVRFGNNLKTLDLSGNKELTNIDHLVIPESVSELRIPPELVDNLPAYIIERANKKQLLLKQSLPF